MPTNFKHDCKSVLSTLEVATLTPKMNVFMNIAVK